MARGRWLSSARRQVRDNTRIEIEYIEEKAPDPTRWPVRPSPMPDELLSSWLNRVAVANGLAPKSFHLSLARAIEWKNTIVRYQKVDAETRLKLKETAWVDFCCNGRLTEYLAERSGVSPGRIQGMSLRRPPDADARARPPMDTLQWELVETLIDRVSYDRERYAYMRFCPKCLQEWKDPWFKKSWRLDFMNVCVRHGCRLETHCVCGRGVRPHLLAQAQPQSICYACGYDLLHREAEPAPIESIREQWEINWRLYDGVEKILKHGCGQSKIAQMMRAPLWSAGRGRLDLRFTGTIDVFNSTSPVALRLLHQSVIRRLQGDPRLIKAWQNHLHNEILHSIGAYLA